MSKDSFLVVGARGASLGWYVKEFLISNGMKVQTAGEHDEDAKMDILDTSTVIDVLDEYRPSNVVCTVGVNKEDTPFDPNFDDTFSEAISVNVFGPLNMLRLWFELGCARPHSQFVFISSNSAHIARSKSASYCMSKAALSMGIRCAARAFAAKNPGTPVNIYGWEFGGLYGTPMSREVRDRLGPDVPFSRMPGLPNGIPTADAAEMVMGALMSNGTGLNGSLLRMDGGEQ